MATPVGSVFSVLPQRDKLEEIAQAYLDHQVTLSDCSDLGLPFLSTLRFPHEEGQPSPQGWDKAAELVDSYFSPFCREIYVNQQGIRDASLGRRYVAGSIVTRTKNGYARADHLLKTALKIISYITVIVPLIMLVAKAVCRRVQESRLHMVTSEEMALLNSRYERLTARKEQIERSSASSLPEASQELSDDVIAKHYHGRCETPLDQQAVAEWIQFARECITRLNLREAGPGQYFPYVPENGDDRIPELFSMLKKERHIKDFHCWLATEYRSFRLRYTV